MKLLQSSIFRAICSIVIGVLLLKFPDSGVRWLTLAIGTLFLLSGLIAMISYWMARRHAHEYTVMDRKGRVISGAQPTFPIVGVGSIILGLTLMVSTEGFVRWMMYILGAMLILGAINQLIVLMAARRFGSFSGYFWVAPVAILITGIFVVVKPMESAAIPLIIIGWCMLVYGVTEIINSLMVYSLRRRLRKQEEREAREQANEAEAVEIVDEPRENREAQPHARNLPQDSAQGLPQENREAQPHARNLPQEPTQGETHEPTLSETHGPTQGGDWESTQGEAREPSGASTPIVRAENTVGSSEVPVVRMEENPGEPSAPGKTEPFAPGKTEPLAPEKKAEPSATETVPTDEIYVEEE